MSRSGRLDPGRCGASLARRPNAARCHRRGQDAGHHPSAHPALGGRQQSGGAPVAHTACLRCWPYSRPSWRQQSLGPVAPCLPRNTARHRSCTASCPCLATFSVCSSPPAHHEHASSSATSPSPHHSTPSPTVACPLASGPPQPAARPAGGGVGPPALLPVRIRAGPAHLRAALPSRRRRHARPGGCHGVLPAPVPPGGAVSHGALRLAWGELARIAQEGHVPARGMHRCFRSVWQKVDGRGSLSGMQ